MNLLEVKNLKVHFPVKAGMLSRAHEFVKAVDDVSFSIAPERMRGSVSSAKAACSKTMRDWAIARHSEPRAT